jgi:ABC-type nitrate/sulfonate/bicarbonate transport system substrate-binding protein
MSTLRLHVGGVPEHFNMPWWLAPKQPSFTELGIEIVWHECPGGTGEMMQKLTSGELDIALSLTEGTVAAIANGMPLRILQCYVASSLQWGIHVAANSVYQSPQELREARFAISRLGSGSHLMSFVEAQRQGWLEAQNAELQFVTVGNLQGGIDALSQDRADVFLWERFTTQPWVDQGVFRRIGVCPTPWPAFVWAVREDLGEAHQSALIRLAQWMNQFAPSFQRQADTVQIIAQRCQLQEEQVQQWLTITHWNEQLQVSRSMLNNTTETLQQLGIIENLIDPAALVMPQTQLVD